jgi:hypothetical protein
VGAARLSEPQGPSGRLTPAPARRYPPTKDELTAGVYVRVFLRVGARARVRACASVWFVCARVRARGVVARS